MESYIWSIGTSTPPYKISQKESTEFMCQNLAFDEEEKDKISVLYRATGIDFRYSVIKDYKERRGKFQFYPNTQNLEPFPSVSKRMDEYKKNALPLASAALEDCFGRMEFFEKSKITHLLTVSCTGMYAPGVDIEIIEKWGLGTHIKRTAINFMGCYGAFNALKLADTICKAEPQAVVLVVCLEMCTLHLQKDKEEDSLLAGSLFSDGAAAVVISSEPLGQKSLSLSSFYCDIVYEGKSEMAWHISDFGFEMKLSSYIPDMIKGGIRKLSENLLKFLHLKISDIEFYAIHPGGKRILQVIESELGLNRESNKHAYEVLRNYGNMSSPTVLFVLKSIFNSLTLNDAGKNILSFAFGPGLTLESMLLKINYN